MEIGNDWDDELYGRLAVDAGLRGNVRSVRIRQLDTTGWRRESASQYVKVDCTVMMCYLHRWSTLDPHVQLVEIAHQRGLKHGA